MDLSFKRINQLDAQAEVSVSLPGVGSLNCDENMSGLVNFEDNNNQLVTPLLTPKNGSKNLPDPPASNISPPAKRIRTRSAVRGSTKPFSFANQSSDFIYPLTGLLGRSSQKLESENSRSTIQAKASMNKTFVVESQNINVLHGMEYQSNMINFTDAFYGFDDESETKNESLGEPVVIQMKKSPDSNEEMFRVKKKKVQANGAVELKKKNNKTISKIISRPVIGKEVRQYAHIVPKTSNVAPTTGSVESKKKHPPKVVPKSTEGLKILSDYEKRIQRNIEERKKVFEMLKLNEAKLALKETYDDSAPTEAQIESPLAISILPPAPPPVSTPILPPAPTPPALVIEERTPKIQTRRLLQPVRRSLRASLQPKSEPVEPKPHAVQREKRSITSILDKDDRAEYMRNLLPLLKVESDKKSVAPVKLRDELDAFIRKLNGFTLARDNVNVVTMDEICSLSWHPSNSKLLLAAGDKLGNIGFWDVDSGHDIYGGVRIYDIHTHPIFSLSFDQTNPSRIWSTSYDFLHSLDLNHNSFDEVFSVDAVGDTVSTYHVQNCPSTILVSQSNGEVMLVDTRTSYPPAIRFKCLDGNIRSLSKHPIRDHVFLAASSRNGMGLFDLRALTNQPLVSFPVSAITVRGASFSPVSGRLVLQNSGNHLSHSITTIFNVQSGQQARRVTTVNHSNVHFNAKSEWHPQREDVFISGGVEPLNSVDMFDASNGQVVHQFLSMNLKSLCPINSFHPSVPVLACGNRLGRVHVFRPPR